MISFRLFLALLLVASGVIPTSAQQTPTTFPFEPAQLLTVLPSAPAEWTLTRSEAETTLGEWLETRATRVFHSPPQPAVNNKDTATTGEVEIAVTDTAGFAPSLAAFVNFTPGKNGAVEKKLIGSLPAIVFAGENGGQLTQVLVANRYIVEISLSHLPSSKIEDWLRGFHFDSLPPKPPAPMTRQRDFRLTHVDELHPENNRSYSVSTTSSKRVSDFLKTLPAEKEKSDEPVTAAATH